MASATVMIVIRSVRVVNNGATPDEFGNAPVSANLSVMGSLLNPNGEIQQAQVSSSIVPISMLSNVAVNFDTSDPWSKGTGPAPSLMFKTRIEGQCPLLVEVCLAPHPDLFLTVLQKVVSNFGGVLVALVPGGAVVQAVLTGVLGFLGDALKKESGGHVEPIGQGPHPGPGAIMINVLSLTSTPQPIRVPLTAPNDVSRTYFQPNAPGQQPPVVKVTRNVITKGQANGEVVLEAYTVS